MDSLAYYCFSKTHLEKAIFPKVKRPAGQDPPLKVGICLVDCPHRQTSGRTFFCSAGGAPRQRARVSFDSDRSLCHKYNLGSRTAQKAASDYPSDGCPDPWGTRCTLKGAGLCYTAKASSRGLRYSPGHCLFNVRKHKVLFEFDL